MRLVLVGFLVMSISLVKMDTFHAFWCMFMLNNIDINVTCVYKK